MLKARLHSRDIESHAIKCSDVIAMTALVCFLSYGEGKLVKFFLSLSHVFILSTSPLPHTVLHCGSTSTEAGPQWECAAAIMMASVCGVLRQPEERGNCCSCTLHSWAGCRASPRLSAASRIGSSLSTMSAAHSVACGEGISDEQERAFCAYSEGRGGWLVNYCDEEFFLLPLEMPAQFHLTAECAVKEWRQG